MQLSVYALVVLRPNNSTPMIDSSAKRCLSFFGHMMDSSCLPASARFIDDLPATVLWHVSCYFSSRLGKVLTSFMISLSFSPATALPEFQSTTKGR